MGTSNRSGSTSSLKHLTVKIVRNGQPSASFDVSMTDLRQREDEMKQTAHKFKIPISRWKASKLYQASKRSSNGIVQIDPEKDIMLQNYSVKMEWHPWLTVLFEEFFRTGQLRVPDECKGSDLLLALEYFGILYAPGQLVFASFLVYQRVRCWSDYLSHRTALGDWVAGRIQETQAAVSEPGELNGEVLFFATMLNKDERATAGDLHIPGLGYDADNDAASFSLIYRLFNTSNDNHVAKSLQDDFCVYLQSLFVDEIRATFAVKMIEISSNRATNRSLRAILKIEFVSSPDLDGDRSGHSWNEQEESTLQSTQRNIRKRDEGSPSQRKVFTSKSESSPDEVTNDIYDCGKSEKKDPLMILPPNLPKHPSPRGPDMDERDDFYKAATRKKPYSGRPPEMDLSTPLFGPTRPRSVNPAFATGASGWNAPFDIVDPERLESQTVTSALTGPHFPSDDSHTIDTAVVRAEALRHDWVQGNLLTRDISKQMRELLEVPETDEADTQEGLVGSTSEKLIEPRQVLNFNYAACQTWDWISTVCQGSPSAWEDGSVGYEVPSSSVLSKPTKDEDQKFPLEAIPDTPKPLPPNFQRSRTQPHALVSPTALSVQKSRTQPLSMKLDRPMKDSPLILEGTHKNRMLVKERLKKIEKYDWKVEPKRREPMPAMEEEEDVEEKEEKVSPSRPEVSFDTSLQIVSTKSDVFDSTLKVGKESSRVCLGALFCRRKVPGDADNE